MTSRLHQLPIKCLSARLWCGNITWTFGIPVTTVNDTGALGAGSLSAAMADQFFNTCFYPLRNSANALGQYYEVRWSSLPAQPL